MTFKEKTEFEDFVKETDPEDDKIKREWWERNFYAQMMDTLIHLFARHLHLHLCIHQWIHARTTQTPLCRISGLGVAPPRDPACQGDAAHRGVTWLCSLLTGLHGEGAGLAAGESGRHPRRVCGRRCHRGLGPLPSTPTPCCPPPDSTCSADVRGGGRGELRPIGF